MTVRESGRDAVMVNCNPETVSTDYDTSDRLYFEPLTLEDVLAIVEVEQPEGVIVQFGGQTPLKLAAGLERGGRAAARHLARRDRPRRGPRPLRRRCWSELGLQGAAVRDRALASRRRSRPRRSVGFPLLVRPSYVLGGRAMEIVYSADGLRDYLRRERYGDEQLRFDPDAARTAARRARSSSTASWRTRSRSTSTRSATARTSGSAGSCSTSRRPASTPATRPACCRRTRSAARCSTRSARATRDIALALGVVGLINVQYAVLGEDALRDRGQPARLADGAVRLQGDRAAARQARLPGHARRAARRPRPARTRPDAGDHVSVKEAVLPFDRFAGADALLGPEMRSTGEVMGVARDFPTAFAKAQAAAGARAARRAAPCSSPSPTPTRPAVGGDRRRSCTTSASASSPRAAPRRRSRGWAIPRRRGLHKIGEGSPNVVDWIERGDVDLVINTPTGTGARTDGWEIRRAAVARGIPCITTLAGGMAAARAIAAGRAPGRPVVCRSRSSIEGSRRRLRSERRSGDPRKQRDLRAQHRQGP